MSYVDISIYGTNTYGQTLATSMVEAAYKKTLEDNEALFKNNREQLTDFYFSQQYDDDAYLKTYFNLAKPGQPDDYPHNLILTQLNITAKLIDKKAKNYLRQPRRLIDGEPDEDYDELLLAMGIKTGSKLMDRLTWLLGDHCIVLIADKNTKKLRLEQPPYYRPVFADGDMINPVGVAYPIGMMRNKKGELVEAWEHWDADNHIVFENKTWNIISEEPNPHGCFNAIFTHRMKPFRGHWTRDAQDLIDTNRDINITLTSINNALRLVGFPNLAAIGMDPKDAADVVIRFDKLLCISPPMGSETQIDLKYLYPNINWDQLMGTIKTRVELLASTWNVDIRWEVSGDLASGVALKILSMDNRDDINEMCELYEEFFEVPLFEKLQIISGKISWMSAITGKKLTLDWPEDDFIESPTERASRIQGEITANLTNPIDEMKAVNPDLSDEDAAKQYLRNVAVNSLSKGAGTLTMESILAALEPSEAEIAGVLNGNGGTEDQNVNQQSQGTDEGDQGVGGQGVLGAKSS